MQAKPAKPYQVLVTWEQSGDNGCVVERDGKLFPLWNFWARGTWFATLDEAKALYMNEVNNNGHIDPGNDQFRSVEIQVRFQQWAGGGTKEILTSDAPCTPERNAYWMAKAREALASAKGPLFDEKRRKEALGIK